MSEKTPHTTASKGFEAQADAYAQARPSYPPEALQLLSDLAPGPRKLVDLGAGTGIMTQLLDAQGLYDITAVEPVDSMRAKIPSPIRALKGTAWSIPVDDNSQDIVMMAQCFHWFDDLKSLQEIHRVLKPGGLAVMIWNMESKERSEWIAKLRALYEVYDGAAPQYRLGYWQNVFKTPEAERLFELPLQHQRFVFDRPAPFDSIWPRILSKSYIAILDQDKIDQLKRDVDEVIHDPSYALGEQVLYLHDTDMYWCRKK